MKVRTRFAPSPTGYLHIGGLRTALYNYGGVLNKHRTFKGISEFEEQIDPTPDYLFQLPKGGEVESR